MNENDKVVLNYFYSRIKARISQIVKEEIKATEYNAKHLTEGLGLEAELKLFEDLLNRRMDALRSPSGQYFVPAKFSKKELQQKEFDSPSIIENRREVYDSPYEARKEEFINDIANRYSLIDILDYTRNRMIGIKELISDPNKYNGKRNRDRTSLFWISTYRKEQKRLYSSLITENIIEEIELDAFIKHFEGIITNPCINFIPPKAFVFYLLERLKKYIDAGFYTGKDGTPSPAVVAKHFIFNGKALKNPYSVKSKGFDLKFKVYKNRIDKIVNSLAV